MTAIFNFFGGILGYLLWWLYLIFKNYGVAIIFFTIITKVIVLPFSIRQQKSMASQSKMAAKQQELQAKYGKNREKYAEELQKLYDKEGYSPTSGCLMSLLPFPIMLGIFYAVTSPLSNTLHIAKDTVNLAIEYIQKIPGIVSTGVYPELEVVRNFSLIGEKLTMFSPEDLTKIESLSSGFNFLGINLLTSPSENPFSLMILIPILSVVFQLAMTIYQQRVTRTQQAAAQGQGCMKVMMYGLPLLSGYWSFSFPAAVGIYWVMSAVVGFLQSFITQKFFSTHHIVARQEASRAVTLELADSKIKPLSGAAQAQIASKIEAGNRQVQNNQANKSSKSSKKTKKSSSKGGQSSNYQGKKK